MTGTGLTDSGVTGVGLIGSRVTGVGLNGSGVTGTCLNDSGVTGAGLTETERSATLLAITGKAEVDSTDSEITGTDLYVWEMTSVDLTGSGET